MLLLLHVIASTNAARQHKMQFSVAAARAPVATRTHRHLIRCCNTQPTGTCVRPPRDNRVGWGTATTTGVHTPARPAAAARCRHAAAATATVLWLAQILSASSSLSHALHPTRHSAQASLLPPSPERSTAHGSRLTARVCGTGLRRRHAGPGRMSGPRGQCPPTRTALGPRPGRPAAAAKCAGKPRGNGVGWERARAGTGGDWQREARREHRPRWQGAA